jgi:hypothetical protein
VQESPVIYSGNCSNCYSSHLCIQVDMVGFVAHVDGTEKHLVNLYTTGIL